MLQVWGAYIWRGLYIKGLIFGILRCTEHEQVKGPFLLPSYYSSYALSPPLLGTSALGSSPFGTFVTWNAID